MRIRDCLQLTQEKWSLVNVSCCSLQDRKNPRYNSAYLVILLLCRLQWMKCFHRRIGCAHSCQCRIGTLLLNSSLHKRLQRRPSFSQSARRYMEMRHAQLQKKKAEIKPEAYDGPVGGIDDHPFDLPTYPGMQDRVRTLFDSPEQCPPCDGSRRRRLLSGGCGC